MAHSYPSDDVGRADSGSLSSGADATLAGPLLASGSLLGLALFAVANGAFTIEIQVTHDGSTWTSAKTVVGAAPSAGGDGTYTRQASYDGVLPCQFKLVLSNKAGTTLLYRVDWRTYVMGGAV